MELDYIFFLRATRKFYEVELIDFNFGNGLIGFDLVDDDGNIFYSNSGEGDICKFIGINDIDGKKIYADSSIFEFEFNNYKYYGFISYCNNTLTYSINFLAYNDKTHFRSSRILSGNTASFDNFKVVDTIQENKLGLIK